MLVDTSIANIISTPFLSTGLTVVPVFNPAIEKIMINKEKYRNEDFILMLCKFPLENKFSINFGLKLSVPKTLLYLPL
jgi:hypothetical protein